MASQHNTSEEVPNFAHFFECWLVEQDRQLQALLDAAAAPRPQGREQEEEEDHRLRHLVERVLGHYEYYYRTKSASAKRDVLPMFKPRWTSSTENLFLWVGGWRPSTAFHILYSKSSLQVESQLDDLVLGGSTRDLADLSQDQLVHIDQLQQRTIRLEKAISEEEARAQETVAALQMVDVSHVITEMRRAEGEGEVTVVEMMEPEMKQRRDAMEKVLARADQLRLDTLKGTVEILKPAQAVHFLVAAAELYLRVHEFGKIKDETAAAAARVVKSG